MTPAKLAAFYKAVGGDYDCMSKSAVILPPPPSPFFPALERAREGDPTRETPILHLAAEHISSFFQLALFVDMPHQSISYIWQVTGCQHSLQPVQDDFAPPSIPALTYRGFSRWQSLEILLGPEEHVPFLQYAVKHWGLKHPDTGREFPPHLPAHVFPAEPDAQVDRWHRSCADRLRSEAASIEGGWSRPRPRPRMSPPGEATEANYPHVRSHAYPPAQARSRSPPAAVPRPRTTRIHHRVARPVSYAYVPSAHLWRGSRRPPSPSLDGYGTRTRRRSFSDYPSPPPDDEAPPYHYQTASHLEAGARRWPGPRRHSHPTHSSSDSSDLDDMGSDSVEGRPRRRQNPASPPPPQRRFAAAVPPGQPTLAAGGPFSARPHRWDPRPDDARGRSLPSPLGSWRKKLTETVSNFLPEGLGPDRPRARSRNTWGQGPERARRRSREQVAAGRRSGSYSDLGSDELSDREHGSWPRRPRRRGPEEREEERYRRQRLRDLDHDRSDGREESSRQGGHFRRRPDPYRRASSHGDVEREKSQAGWEWRERAWERG